MNISLEVLLATKTNIEKQREEALSTVQNIDGALQLLNQLINLANQPDKTTTGTNGSTVLGT